MPLNSLDAMRLLAFIVYSFLACILIGCAAPLTSNVPIENAEGGALLAEATQAARRVISERQTATIQAVTLSAGATRQAAQERTTATAQALWVEQEQASSDATASALTIERAQTRQAATATADAQTMSRHATRTAAAQQATQTADSATATTNAQELQISLARQQATATAQALFIQQAETQHAADRARAWSEFFDSLTRGVFTVLSLALTFILLFALARYLETLTMRGRLIETRSGTILIARINGQYAAQLIQQTTFNPAYEIDAPSQAHIVENEAPELFKLTTTQGETFIAKSEPESELSEQRRRLAMRLLRESLRYYGSRGHDARNVNRLPSFRDLGWSSETWVRAVGVLKPFVIAKQGRGGGTYCAEQFPTLIQLYAAVGERRIALSSGEGTPLLAAG